MKPIQFSALVFLIGFQINAQSADTTWKKGGTTGLNFSQVGLKHWAGGGDNSLAFSGLLSLYANYKFEKTTWDNSLELGYGLVKQGDLGVRKSDDKIIYVGKYGRDFTGDWKYSGLLDFRSQFASGYDYSKSPKTTISKLMAPAYLTLALGADYRPSDKFSALISPITGKATFVTDKKLSDAAAFGVDSGKTVRTEFGWFINSQYKSTVMTGIDFTSKLNLFSSYQDIKHVDVNWENQLLMKVNQYVSASFATQLIFDNDVKDARSGKAEWQFKEVLSAGLLYKF